MTFDTSNWPAPFRGIGSRFGDWLASVGPETLLLTALCVGVVFLTRKLVARLCFAILQSLLARFSIVLSDEVKKQLSKATEILVVTFSLYIALEVLRFPELADQFFLSILNSVAIIAVFGTWYQLSGPFASILRSDSLTPVNVEEDWIQRITQFAIVMFGIASLLKVWQVDISGALTGVGVLGAGLAIATQDLIRNLVAGMTNMSEQRFQTGDAIEVQGEFIGSVKRVDLRSTLVIGFDQVPRYIPNSDLSNSVVLNYSAMRHRRILMKVPLVRSSTLPQIEAVRDGLRNYHKTCGDFDLGTQAPQHIYVNELGPNSVDIMIYVWTKGPDYTQLLQVTERITLAIMSIVQDAGTQLAYSTQTIRIDPDEVLKPPREEL